MRSKAQIPHHLTRMMNEGICENSFGRSVQPLSPFEFIFMATTATKNSVNFQIAKIKDNFLRAAAELDVFRSVFVAWALEREKEKE